MTTIAYFLAEWKVSEVNGVTSGINMDSKYRKLYRLLNILIIKKILL
jgi:hypothetical protein